MFETVERGNYQHKTGYNSGRRRLRRLRRDPAALALVKSVAAVRGVAMPDLLRVTRGKAAVADARHLAMYLIHVQLGRPLAEVGFLFGRDRTTVTYACQLIEDRRDLKATENEIARVAATFQRTRSGRHVL